MVTGGAAPAVSLHTFIVLNATELVGVDATIKLLLGLSTMYSRKSGIS